MNGSPQVGDVLKIRLRLTLAELERAGNDISKTIDTAEGLARKISADVKNLRTILENLMELLKDGTLSDENKRSFVKIAEKQGKQLWQRARSSSSPRALAISIVALQSILEQLQSFVNDSQDNGDIIAECKHLYCVLEGYLKELYLKKKRLENKIGISDHENEAAKRESAQVLQDTSSKKGTEPGRP